MYHDLLVRIKNAEMARKKSIRVPLSKMDFEIAEILAKFRFIQDARRKTLGKKKFIDLELFSREEKKGHIQFKIKSRPSRHFYVSARELRPVMQGFGIGMISTSQGIMASGDARKRRLGGEYLFEIW